MSRSRTVSQLDTSLELTEQNRLFDAALDNMIQGLCMFDDEQRLIVCNRRYLEMYGFSGDVVRPGITLREILEYSVAIGNYTPADARAALAERPIQADLPTEATYEQHLADGRIIAVMHRPMSSGGSVATYQDITDQRVKEQENIELTRVATAALDNMIQGLCMFDDAQRLIVCNRRYLEMYGFSGDVVRPGITLREILEYSVAIGNYAPADARAALAERPVQADLPTEATYEQHLADGRIIAVMHGPMPGGGSVATYQDITAQRQQEHENIELTRLATTAAAANRAKSAFLANMSHELRTPINAIVGFAETIAARIHGPLGSHKYEEYLADIVASARQLTKTIDDVLEMARAEAGELRLEESAFALDAALAKAIDGTEPAAAERRIRVVSLSTLPPMRVNGDRAKITQALAHILANAIKFTLPDGTVRVRLAPVADGVAVHVSDNGIGMTRAEIARAVTPFGQVAGAYSRQNGGSGLGLPIGRAFIEAHGGTLSIESEPGVGSVVTVMLPADRVLSDVLEEPVPAGALT